MIELTDEYKQIAAQFKLAFGHGVPLAIVPDSETTDQLIANIRRCLTAGEDQLERIYGYDSRANILL